MIGNTSAKPQAARRPQTQTDARPPGRVTRAISRNAAARSAANINPNPQVTASNAPSGAPVASMSLRWNTTLPTPALTARRRASVTIFSETSFPVTIPVSPTARAATNAPTPGPVARSSTRSPACGAARATHDAVRPSSSGTQPRS